MEYLYIAQRIRMLMSLHGMKNEAELERSAEVEQGTIALISDTNIKPDTKTLFKFAKVFNVPTELLLTKNTIRAAKVIAALSIQEGHKARIAEYFEKEADYLSKAEAAYNSTPPMARDTRKADGNEEGKEKGQGDTMKELLLIQEGQREAMRLSIILTLVGVSSITLLSPFAYMQVKKTLNNPLYKYTKSKTWILREMLGINAYCTVTLAIALTTVAWFITLPLMYFYRKAIRNEWNYLLNRPTNEQEASKQKAIEKPCPYCGETIKAVAKAEEQTKKKEELRTLL
ncbi:membrane protein [Candidatus Magnetobacterium bavaricum]|uniref:Membrane protein n=1 Tax=Candidatus Magnetobacterium bavaricum TaxID=29290 RepID=A0A0F3GXR1_9BACT|nr:membrane protein [Candidatus Magnetobacterium bavaricum]